MKLLYEGKAKQILEADQPDQVIIRYKDDATAGNGAKKGTILNKGVLNNEITTLLYDYLKTKGIPTHHLKTLNDRDQLCIKVAIIPLEVIIRNRFAGSIAKRLGVEEGRISPVTIKEICYKCDELNDPLINDDQALALELVTKAELKQIYEYALQINRELCELFCSIHIDLIDFKIEFGKTSNGTILLADEISPDTCRLWDSDTQERLDKDRFRRDLGNVEAAYQEIAKRLKERMGF